MKRLSMGDWSVIARYLKNEASPEDVDHFNDLVDRCPNLRDQLTVLGPEINVPVIVTEDAFDAGNAFAVLTERFKKENLI